MKTKNIIYTVLVSFILLFTNCNEDEFLKEEPLDFFSPENSFDRAEHFESALADLYARIRYIQIGYRSRSLVYFHGTDIMKDARLSNNTSRMGNYVNVLNPSSPIPEWHWTNWYKVVANSNTIIERLEDSELTEDEKIKVEAEAKFFRAFAYRFLVYLYGGVPLVLTESKTPKTDYTRDTKEAVLNQMVEDLSFATNNLPGIDEVVDGKVSDLVAHHILAETYIALEQWDNAISAASVVIDNANTALMTERFGSRQSEEPGDVFWDLFRRGNQNRSAGNTEGIWVAQIEIDVPGGLVMTDGNYNPAFERQHVPASWTLDDPDGVKGIMTYRSDDNVGGRGVSFMRGTDYMENIIWQSDFDNDIRNADHNFRRDIVYDNPESNYFGQSAIDNPGAVYTKQPEWRWYPWLTKVTTPGNHPDNFYVDPALKTLNSAAGATCHDWYYIRLPETYLLRAEAFLGKGETTNAANDINVIRNRAEASPVDPNDVTIEYILDERARELALEENRRLTLQRLGKLVERVRLFNEHNGDEIEDYHELWPIPFSEIEDYHELWPIPFSEIEANNTGELQQNPGYN